MANPAAVDLLKTYLDNPHPTVEEARAVFEPLTEGDYDDVHMAALLVAIRTRGETFEDIAGAAQAFLAAARPFPLTSVTAPPDVFLMPIRHPLDGLSEDDVFTVDCSMPGSRLAGEGGQEAAPVEAIRHFESGTIEQRRHDVAEFNQRLGSLASGEFAIARRSDDQRYTG